MIGKQIAENLLSGDVILLIGNLGLGKTTLIKGIAKELKVSRKLTSPTYSIVNKYIGKFNIYHFDLYRFNTPNEFFESGFEELIFEENTVSFIEWGDRIENIMNENYYRLELEDLGIFVFQDQEAGF